MGIDVGKSLAEPDFRGDARDIMTEAKQKGCEIMLPVDAVIAREFKDGRAARQVVPTSPRCRADAMILDRRTADRLPDVGQVLEECRTLLWNGPMGAFEIAAFRRRHVRVGARRGGSDEGGQAHVRGGRRRHCRGLERGRRDGRLYLCLDSRRRVPRMARGARAAGHHRFGALK